MISTMDKATARLMVKVLKAVYNRLDDVGVSYMPTAPITEAFDARFVVRVSKDNAVTNLFTVEECLETIKEWTD